MKKALLKFPSIIELIDFQMVTRTTNYYVDRRHNTLTGAFSDADIELAKNGYQATLLKIMETEKKHP